MKGKSELEYYGGNGYAGVPEDGRFVVTYGDETENNMEFASLTIARKFYKRLKCEKALWDISKTAELIEAHIVSNGAIKYDGPKVEEKFELPF